MLSNINLRNSYILEGNISKKNHSNSKLNKKSSHHNYRHRNHYYCRVYNAKVKLQTYYINSSKNTNVIDNNNITCDNNNITCNNNLTDKNNLNFTCDINLTENDILYNTNEIYLGEIKLLSKYRELLNSNIISNHRIPLGNFKELNVDIHFKNKLLSLLELRDDKNCKTIISTSVDLESKNGKDGNIYEINL